MPRNQPRTSSRSRQSTQPPPVQEDSLDETESPSPTKNRRRSPRNLETFRPTPSGAAARVTRSLTRGSKSEPESRDADSDEEESESEPEVTRKRSRSGKKRGAPRKRGRASKGSPGKGGKKKGRPTRRTRKQDSEDEESEESLDLGESEEEEKVVDDEEEEYSKVDAAPTPRKGNRGGTRSSGGGSNATSGSKGSPSVVLERVENVTPPSSGRPARGRSVKQRNEAEIEEEAEDQTPASKRTSSRARRGRPSQQPAKKTRQQPAKMVPSEENAAAITTSTDTVAKEENKDEKEEIPLKEKCEKKAGSEDQQEEPKDTEDEEKMEVDEPSVQSTDEISEVESESGIEKEKPTKHKLEEGKGEEAKEPEPAQKKAKTEDEDEKDDEIEEVESKVGNTETKDSKNAAEPEAKMDATESTPKVDKEEIAAEKSENNSTFQEGDKKEAAEESATPTIANVTNGEEGDKKSEESAPAPVEPRINGSTSDDGVTANDDEHKATDNGCELESSIIFASLGVKVPRRCVPNSDLNDKVGKDPFTVVSFNLAEEDWTAKHQNLVNEVLQLSPSILCLQEIDEVYFKSSLDSSLKSHGYMGLYKAGKTSTKGLATFYLLSSFEILHHREFEVHELLEKDVEGTNLVDTEKEALKTFLHSPAPVLITKLKSVSNGKTVTIGTVHLPSDDETVLAVQVAAVLREIHNINDGANNPHVLCGSFNLADDSIVYQLLRDGILKNEILEELKKNANVPVPEKENASLAKLLETCLQHPSASLKSSYGSILGHELKFPDKAQKLSKDSLWFSSDSLLTKSILDVGPIAEKTLPNTHISLKAELGFVN